MPMDAAELARWTRFAAKGGIGKCTALCDCVAESADDLMFLKGDEITVLMHLPDNQGLYLGYCEGVVGRFQGVHVQFHSRLKKPVMTKRSSVSASSSHAKSPTPTSGIKSPSPMYQSDSSSPASPSVRRVVTQTSPRNSTDGSVVSAPLNTSVASPAISSPTSHNTSLRQSYSSLISNSVQPVNHPVHVTEDSPRPLPSFPLQVVPTPTSIIGSSGQPASPDKSESSIQSSTSANSTPPTIDDNQHSRHQKPAALPIRNLTSAGPSPPDTSVSTAFDTSTVERISLALSDGEVGIGLSLLQDMANDGEFGDWSDTDEDRIVLDRRRTDHATERDRRWSNGGSEGIQYSVEHRENAGGSDSDSIAERLGYEDTETGHGSHDHHSDDNLTAENDTPLAPSKTRVPSNVYPTPPHTSPFIMTFPPVAPLSPRSKFRPPYGTQFDFPAPPTHMPPSPPSPHRSSSQYPPASPKVDSPSLPDDQAEPQEGLTRERRPSLATSTLTTTSTSDWEGAGDIYDDYRYSRFSMGAASRMSMSSSKMSLGAASRRMSASSSARMSISSRLAGGYYHGVEPVPPFVDNPEARSRVDSNATRPSMDSRPSIDSRPSMDTQASGHASGQTTSPPKYQSPADKPKPRLNSGPAPRPTGEMELSGTTENRTSFAASESDASVYSSEGNGLDTDKDLDLSLQTQEPISGQLSTSQKPVTSRPTPLNLVEEGSSSQNARSPLLHTNWGSPLSSAGFEATTTTRSPTNTLVATTTATGYTGTGEGFDGKGALPASATYFPSTPSILSDGSSKQEASQSHSVAGITSSHRQQIEDHQLLFPPENRNTEDRGDVIYGKEEDFRASRLVVEGDEYDGNVTMVGVDPQSKDAEQPHLVEDMELRDSPSPEPELARQARLAPLIITNRTPSPASLSHSREESESQLQALQNTTVTASPIVPSFPDNSPASRLEETHKLSSLVLPPSRLRPSLHELRGGDPNQPGGQRRSLFLPHPNAPKAPNANSPGPMYISQQQPQVFQGPMKGGALETIQMALTTGSRGLNRGPTIYGRTVADLANSIGPVPIFFSADPPPATAPPPGSFPIHTRIPDTLSPHPPPILAPQPSRAAFGHATLLGGEKPLGSTSSPDGSATAKPTDLRPASVDQQKVENSGVIPRANFFPKVGGVRPRSRSFSGFNSTSAEIPLPIQRSRDEMPSAAEIRQSISSSSPSSQLSASPPGSSLRKLSPLRVSSPLSDSEYNMGRNGLRVVKPPSSPLAQTSFNNPNVAPPSPTAVGTVKSLQTTKTDFFISRPPPISRATLPSVTIDPTASVISVPSLSRDRTVDAPSPAPMKGRPSIDSINSNSSNLLSLSNAASTQPSLRTKLSLPNLRRTPNRQDDSSNISPAPEQATVQVQDMDFELVRPKISNIGSPRTSEDSGFITREASIDNVRHDSSSLAARSDSPSVRTAPRSPVDSSGASAAWRPATLAPTSLSKHSESESDVDAHRQRESKWMSTLAAVPAPQARKSKKVKKLLLDGVPSSLRYIVWSHLMDGKARIVPGVYTQLSGRGKVPVYGEIERDVQRFFVDHPHLQNTKGGVLSLLQAYLAMVPDVHYSSALTLIAGQLLLLAPEEDAFWIFVSIMDTYLRAYFSPSATQLDVDAALFSRALESSESNVAKKIFVDMGITPSSICRPWFSSLFVESLPATYLDRVWDVFLYEGIPFLIRVGLAIVSSCRRQILESSRDETVLSNLRHPPIALLPPTPDTFITLAFSFKVKDDDVRKQRIKMEAQVKRQTQAPRLMSNPGTISLPQN